MSRLGRVRVAGHSMEPSLRHGDELLYVGLPPRPGSVVVARDLRDEIADRLVVKRVAAIDGDDVILESDHPGHEGLLVDRAAIVGRVVLRFRWTSSFGAVKNGPLR